MSTQSVSTAASELISQSSSRENSINQKIAELGAQLVAEKSIISQLMKNLIESEMTGDQKKQAAINKELIQHRTTHDGLDERIRAYRESLEDKNFLRTGVANIFEVAQSAREQRQTEAKAGSEELEQIDKQIRELQERREKITIGSRFFHTQNDADQRTIISLLKHIENRPISFGDELAYLMAFADGASREELERRFVVGIKQEQKWIPPQQQFHRSEPERQPGEAIQSKTTTFQPYGY